MSSDDTIVKAKECLKTGGIENFEIYLCENDVLRIEAKDGAVHSLLRSKETGIALRVMIHGAVGFAYGNNVDSSLIDAAVLSAKYQFSDEHNKIPLTHGQYNFTDIYDKRFETVSDKECIERSAALEDAAYKSDPRIKQVRKASFSKGTESIDIFNSEGIKVSQKSTFCSASIMTMAKDESGMQAGYDYDFSHALDGFDIERIGRDAAQDALTKLGARQIDTARLPVLFNRDTASELLEFISEAFLGENVIKGKSFLKDKEGKKCFSDCINIYDNPVDKRAVNAYMFDAEGLPSQKTLLVEKGEVKNFLFDSYWGHRAGRPSTGNSVRNGYRTAPRLSSRNFCLSPTETDMNEALKGLGKVMKVTGLMGMHTADAVSGEFSIGIEGILLDGNQPLFPVRGAVLAGNVFKMFSMIDVVGNDMRCFGNVSTPSILTGKMDISSK